MAQLLFSRAKKEPTGEDRVYLAGYSFPEDGISRKLEWETKDEALKATFSLEWEQLDSVLRLLEDAFVKGEQNETSE